MQFKSVQIQGQLYFRLVYPFCTDMTLLRSLPNVLGVPSTLAGWNLKILPSWWTLAVFSYGFPLPHLVEFHPPPGNFVLRHNSRSSLWGSRAPRLCSPLRNQFLYFLAIMFQLFCPQILISSTKQDHCVLLGIPILLCGPESAYDRKPGWSDHRVYLIWSASLCFTVLYCLPYETGWRQYFSYILSNILLKSGE